MAVVVVVDTGNYAFIRSGSGAKLLLLSLFCFFTFFGVMSIVNSRVYDTRYLF